MQRRSSILQTNINGKYKGKDKGKGKVVSVPTMKAHWGSRGIVPPILSLSNRWTWVTSCPGHFTPWESASVPNLITNMMTIFIYSPLITSRYIRPVKVTLYLSVQIKHLNCSSWQTCVHRQLNDAIHKQIAINYDWLLLTDNILACYCVQSQTMCDFRFSRRDHKNYSVWCTGTSIWEELTATTLRIKECCVLNTGAVSSPD